MGRVIVRRLALGRFRVAELDEVSISTSRTPQAYDRERDFMIRQGIPASYLPEPEPGRYAPAEAVR